MKPTAPLKVTKKAKDPHKNLTVGKTYDVVSIDNISEWYEIIDDTGKLRWYDQSRFNTKPAHAPSNPLMKCHISEGTAYLTLGKEYEVIGSTDTHLTVINDTGERYSYEKYHFDPAGKVPAPAPAPQAPAVTSHEHDAYQKIVKVEKYETTDGKSFLIQNEAMKHQLLLNAKEDFVGPVIDVADRDYFDNVAIEMEDMLTWAKDYPDSFDTLVRLVGEQ